METYHERKVLTQLLNLTNVVPMNAKAELGEKRLFSVVHRIFQKELRFESVSLKKHYVEPDLVHHWDFSTKKVLYCLNFKILNLPLE
jgi:hypothetical protein